MSYSKLLFLLLCALALKILNLQSQVKHLQNLLSNRESLQTSELTGKYLPLCFSSSDKSVTNTSEQAEAQRSQMWGK